MLLQPDGSWVPSQANFTSLATPNAVGSGKVALVTLLHEGEYNCWATVQDCCTQGKHHSSSQLFAACCSLCTVGPMLFSMLKPDCFWRCSLQTTLKAPQHLMEADSACLHANYDKDSGVVHAGAPSLQTAVILLRSTLAVAVPTSYNASNAYQGHRVICGHFSTSGYNRCRWACSTLCQCNTRQPHVQSRAGTYQRCLCREPEHVLGLTSWRCSLAWQICTLKVMVFTCSSAI